MAFSQHPVLSFSFLEYVVSVLDRTPLPKTDVDKGEIVAHSVEFQNDHQIQQAAILAITAFFRYILARDGEHKDKEKLIDLIQEIASCTSMKRPKEVIS
ncbi:hypothetical protein BHE74_00059057 [Ensete ventricosum]|nr:hypothetical protein GW17_00008022 [Ensete ventricosum]RWW35951.1 hypothetical protein BHE74_00059057 [Ensete ventricosum]